MFIVSKKSLLLPVIFFTVFNIHSSERKTVIITSGVLNFDTDGTEQNKSPLWELGKIFLPIAGGALINYAIQKYNEDPEIAAINKDLKKIELQTHSHPDFPAIIVLNKKNEAEECRLKNKEKEIELSITTANVIKHHQDEWAKFKKCDSPFTRDFCDHMIKLHEKKLDEFINNTQNDTQS
jgi:hypothetical protein